MERKFSLSFRTSVAALNTCARGNYMPHTKHAEIERSNKGVDVDNLLVPNE